MATLSLAVSERDFSRPRAKYRIEVLHHRTSWLNQARADLGGGRASAGSFEYRGPPTACPSLRWPERSMAGSPESGLRRETSIRRQRSPRKLRCVVVRSQFRLRHDRSERDGAGAPDRTVHHGAGSRTHPALPSEVASVPAPSVYHRTGERRASPLTTRPCGQRASHSTRVTKATARRGTGTRWVELTCPTFLVGQVSPNWGTHGLRSAWAGPGPARRITPSRRAAGFLHGAHRTRSELHR